MDGKPDRPSTSRETSSTGSNYSQSHSHIPNMAGCQDDNNPFQASALNDFLTVLALSFHSVFEGLAVGLETEPHNIWILFAGIFQHLL